MADYDDRYRGHDDRQTDRSRMDRDRTERGRTDEDRYRRGGYGGEFRREFGGGDYGSLDFYGSRDYGGDAYPPARFRDEERQNEGRQDQGWRDHGRRDQGYGRRSGRDYGRTDYAGGMRDDMRRFTGDRDPGWSGYRGHPGQDTGSRRGHGGNFDDDRGRRDYDIGGFGGRYDEGSSGARGGNRESGYGYGGAMGQDYGQGYSSSAYRTASGGSYDRGGPGRGDDDRGFFSRAGDEIASWFGSEPAEQRRERDARQGDSGAQHHVGRGPRNYQRSDSRIQEDINDRLTADPYLDASDIEVAVSNGEATLTGTVRSRHDKRRAEDIADDVSGIRHVQNNLRVQDQRQGGLSGSAGSYGSIGGGFASTGSMAGTMAGTLAGGGSTAASGALNSSDRGSNERGSNDRGSGFQSTSTRPDTSTGGTGAVTFASGSGNSDQVRPGDTASGSNAGAAGRSTQIGGAASSRSDIGGGPGSSGSGGSGSGNDKP